MSFTKEFKLLLKARYPIIYCLTKEEERLEYIIKLCIKDLSINRNIYVWDFVEGYKGNPNDNGFGAKNPLQALEWIEKMAGENPAIFILKDFHIFLNDLSITRKLKNISKLIRSLHNTIIIISTELSIPDSLKDITTILEFKLPQPSEIKVELFRVQNALRTSLPEPSVDILVRCCQGLSVERIRKVLSKVISTYKELNIESVDIIFTEKKQIIKQTKILEFCTIKEKMSDIGGLENLKSWLQKRIGALSQRAEKYGLPYPRGLFLVGVQGTGKSLTAKVIANEWKLPLLRLDVGKLFGGIIGESELKMRQTIELTETMAPCILWIDEIDKAFGGSEVKGDSGTTHRVLATFITWLSEKKSPVFVVATANNISLLPSELIRKGRFDEIFFIGLPNEEEKKSIFKIHLNQVRPKSWNTYNINMLARLAEKFSGAEIQEAIVDAMHTAFNENREFTSNDIQYSIKQCIPLAYTNYEKIEYLQEWANSGRVRLASSEQKNPIN
nr:photosystem I assembly protein Ycf46 [Cryptomonas borealis]